MSGGRFEYLDEQLHNEIFGYNLNLNYGEKGFENSKQAAILNPMQDREISEILHDVLVLVHSFDYYDSGDICEETYRRDVKRFKEKWFKKTDKKRIDHLVELAVAKFAHDVRKEFKYAVTEYGEDEYPIPEKPVHQKNHG